VPLLRRSYELWRELERAAEEQLLFITGGVDAGPRDGRIVQGSLASCREHNLDHEVLTARELAARHPGWRLPDDFAAVVQPEAGFVASERAIVAHARLAMEKGADLRAREPLIEWGVTGTGTVEVRTPKGRYEAGRLVISTGAWISEHVPALEGKAVPERQVLGWFRPKVPEHFRMDRFPVGIVDAEPHAIYVFPEWGIPGFKIGVYHHLEESGTADALSREPTARDEDVLRKATETYFPDAAGPILSMRGCLFTNTEQYRGRALRHRYAAPCAAGGGGLALLGPRLQVLLRGGGGPGRPSGRGEVEAGPGAVQARTALGRSA
jgi:sarcosine oxidase